MDEISNIVRDIYDLDIYQSEVTGTKSISQQEYDKFENVEGKLSPELIESLVEKPNRKKEKRFYVEDIRNCIIHNYKYESFKRERTCYAIITGEIVFQVEYRIKEKVLIDVPFNEEFTITAGKIKIKRAAIKNKQTETGEKLILAGIILAIFKIVAFLALVLTIIFAFRDYWIVGLWLAGLMGTMWLVGYFGKYLLKIVGILLSWVIVMLVMGFIITWLSFSDNDTETTSSEEKYEDVTENDSVIYQDEQQIVVEGSLTADSAMPDLINNSLQWQDYSRQRHSFEYRIEATNFKQARQNRSEYIGYSWKAIYQNLYKNDNLLLKDIYQKYDSLRFEANSLDFARIVVSSIQATPYTWILPESCFEAPNKQEIDHSGYACLGNVKNYGIQSPLEFMANQKGDCDTKSLVIYSILKHFNYDVCVMTSLAYEHALLGINIPANGKFKNYQGKKYYVWETTVKGLDIGQLPPTHSNMNLWEVSL